MTGLVVNGTPVCDNCPLDTVGEAIEEAFNGRVLVSFTAPSLYASPRGTRGGITDDVYRHIERTTFDEVPGDSYVAPAMEVVVYSDGTAPSRFIAGFAAISAQARYRIFRVGSDDAGPLPSLPSVTTGDVPRVGTAGTGAGTTAAPSTGDTGPAIAAPPVPRSVVTRLAEGLKVVFRSPGHLAAVAALWTLLALPTYLAARRRLLLDLPFLRRTLEAP